MVRFCLRVLKSSSAIAGCGRDFLGASWFPGEIMTSMCSGMRASRLEAYSYCLCTSLMVSSLIWLG